jgi:uncharacterized membrane protein YbhN (UPF0104 family)
MALFAAAVWFIAHEIQKLGWATIQNDFRALPRSRIALTAGLTVATYFLLSLYDVLAFRYIRNPLPLRQVLFAGFIGYAFSNSISMTPSMAARFKLYRRWGISGGDISRIFFFHYLSTWLGFFVVAGTLFIIEPEPLAHLPFLTYGQRQAIGVFLLGLVVFYFFLGSIFHHGIRFRQHLIPIPAHRLVVAQVLVASFDWSLTALVPYILLSAEAPITYLNFLGVYLVAQITEIVSHVPGGLGVFEGSILLLLKGSVPTSPIIAALLVYRIIYSLIPFAVGAIAFGATEFWKKRH